MSRVKTAGQKQKASTVNSIAKWHSFGVGIRKWEPRGRNLKGMRGLRHLLALRPAEPLYAADYASLRKNEPSLPLGVSRVTDSKCIDWYSVPKELILQSWHNL